MFKKVLLLIVSLFLIIGCSTKEQSQGLNYVVTKPEIENKTIKIPSAYVIGVDRNNYTIQRFDYEGNTFLIYKDCIIEVK